MTRCIRAEVDASLSAVLTDLVPLHYRLPEAVEEHDVPPHVRAASAIRGRGGRLVVFQDDVNAIALWDRSGAEPLLLPVGEGGRRTFDEPSGNKRAKMDLEACAALPDGRLVAFGSGSTSARERLVVLGERPSLVDASPLYAHLREHRAFAGSELNLEGAVVTQGVLRLFQRGNGAPTSEADPVNATGDLPLDAFLAFLEGADPPALENVVQYDLGRRGAAAFTFTDAVALGDGRVAFVACAEASPDTYRDGEILGCRFGIIAGDQARITDIRDRQGRRAIIKIEGIEIHDEESFDVVADMDRPDEPALLGRLRVV